MEQPIQQPQIDLKYTTALKTRRWKLFQSGLF